MACATALLCLTTGQSLPAETWSNSYGLPGLVEMPTAGMGADADVTVSVGRAGPTTRTTFAFQVLPRVTGAFRYSIVDDYSFPGGDLFDRSFDLRFALSEGRGAWPRVTLGLQDFLGTGVFSGEYLVATGSPVPGFEVTGGIGWGRFGSRDGFSNPLGVLGSHFDTRGDVAPGGGRFNASSWFTGDAAFFGGVSWQATDRLRVAAEYSSDAYANEAGRGIFTASSPFNFGISYRLTPAIELSAFSVQGETIGFSLSSTFNPKSPPPGPTAGTAPPPLRVRGVTPPVVISDGRALRAALASELEAEGLMLEYLEVAGATARAGISNHIYRDAPQALGRASRAMSRILPDTVDTFEIDLIASGMAVSRTRLNRADLEVLEYAPDGAWQSYLRAEISDPSEAVFASRPRFEWALGPYLDTELFDPDDPLRADVGLRARGRFVLGEGLFLSGSVRKRAFGTLDQSTRPSNSVLPRVRSDNALYNRAGDPALEYLVAEKFFRPGTSIFGRLSAGYLEKMYGGVSGELLWSPGTAPWALGVEVNYALQRDFDQGFGFRDYDVVTGHVSGYYDLGGGFEAQVDLGRYLAGDWGTTLSLERTFASGVRIGAFATFTDVDFDDFGEGSFDKGISVTVPIAWFTGKESRNGFSTVIRPVLRDGGARVSVPNRLYGTVQGAQADRLGRDWARFWR